MCSPLHVFTCGFNTTVLHHITIVKCVSGCPKIILDAGLVADVKLLYSGLQAHLTWTLSIYFLWAYMKMKVCGTTVGTGEELWRPIQQFSSEIKNTPRIFERLRVSFNAELSFVSANMDRILRNSYKKIKLKKLLVALLFLFFLCTTRWTQEVFKVWPWTLKLE
jgi:hypothetical protein